MGLCSKFELEGWPRIKNCTHIGKHKVTTCAFIVRGSVSNHHRFWIRDSRMRRHQPINPPSLFVDIPQQIATTGGISTHTSTPSRTVNLDSIPIESSSIVYHLIDREFRSDNAIATIKYHPSRNISLPRPRLRRSVTQ